MDAVINGIKMHFMDTKNHEGRPIVLIHGMTFDHRSWNPQIKLLKKNHRVIAYDVRGHGKTDVGDGQYTYKLFVEDLISLLDYLEIDKAVFCGLSMGGAIALRAFEMYPERFSAMILCDTRSEADSNETKEWREDSIELIKQNGLEPFTEEFLLKIFSHDIYSKSEDFSRKKSTSFQNIREHPEAVELIRETILSASPVGICGVLLAQAARTDMRHVLTEIEVPTLIMLGEYDNFTPITSSKYMHENIRNSELKIISEAGHVSNLENKDQFNSYLLEFLEKIVF